MANPSTQPSSGFFLTRWWGRLMEEIDTIIARDPATRSRLEAILCAPGFHALLVYRVSHKLHVIGFRLIARLLSQLARLLTGVEIHPGARIGRRVFIDHGMGVVIGETAYIGNDTSLYHGVTLGGVSPLCDEKGALRHPQVGDGVIIGSGAQLLGPIEVGDYARIGSNAVVVSDVEPGSTMVGIPARPVKSRAVRTKLEAEEHFDAYGLGSEKITDPSTAKLEEEIKRLAKRLKQLEAQSEFIADTAESWEGPEGR